MALETLDKMLEDHNARAEQLREQLDALTREIHVLQAARAALAHDHSSASTSRRSRTLKREWAMLLEYISEVGKASLDDSERFFCSKGIDVNRNTLRSQMALYANEGWLRRIEKGVFQLTSDGAAKIGLDNIC